MVMHGGGPNPDAFTLSDTGRGRLGRGRSRTTILQRRVSDGWIDVARFGSYPAAAKALDDAIATGKQPDDLRLTSVPPPRARLVLAVVGIVLLVIVAAAALSVVIFAS